MASIYFISGLNNVRPFKTADNSGWYIIDVINTFKPVEVSRTGGLSEPYQTLFSAGTYTANDNALH